MTSNPDPGQDRAGPQVPDHDLADALVLTTTAQVKAISHDLRTAILNLLHERAASVAELASAVQRPRSTVAYHVGVLVEAGLLQVVRTRRVRAVEERFYGRTARRVTIAVDTGNEGSSGEALPLDFNDFEVAARESAQAFLDRRLWGFIRHARITEDRAGEFWERMSELVREFELLPRAGDTVYGFAVGIYPTDQRPLPPADDATPEPPAAPSDATEAPDVT